MSKNVECDTDNTVDVERPKIKKKNAQINI